METHSARQGFARSESGLALARFSIRRLFSPGVQSVPPPPDCAASGVHSPAGSDSVRIRRRPSPAPFLPGQTRGCRRAQAHVDHYLRQGFAHARLFAVFAVDVFDQPADERFPDIEDRVHGLELDRGQETQMSFFGIEVEVFSAPAEVPNLGFIVQVGGSTFLHGGDSGYYLTTAADFRTLAAGRQGYRPRIPPLLVLHRPVWRVHCGRSPRPLLRPDALCGGTTIGRLPCCEKPLSSRNLVQKGARDLASMRSNEGGACRSLQGLPNNSLKLTRRAGPSVVLAWPAGVP